MTEDIFKPEYFADCFVVEAIATKANSIFKKWLEAQPKLYGTGDAWRSVKPRPPYGDLLEVTICNVKEIK